MKPLIEEKLRELLAFAEEHKLMEMAWQENGFRIAFRRNPEMMTPSQASVPEETQPPQPVEVLVRSPMVGTFRRALSKDRPPLVMEGNHIKPGDRLGVVECMKIPTDVVSYCAGQIKKILVEDGHPVEYGQPLFEVTPVETGSN